MCIFQLSPSLSFLISIFIPNLFASLTSSRKVKILFLIWHFKIISKVLEITFMNQ